MFLKQRTGLAVRFEAESQAGTKRVHAAALLHTSSAIIPSTDGRTSTVF
jgi:hypothetical protein